MWIAIYALAWVLVTAVAGILFATGGLNETSLAIFGFLASGLLFAGVVAILPWWVDRSFSPAVVKAGS